MSFALFTDGCSNLSGELLRRFDIRLIACAYTIDGRNVTYSGDIDSFDAHDYYDRLRSGAKVTTSLINTHQFLEAFRPVLREGQDVVYVGLSGGISGTIQAARIAAEELAEEFHQRTVRIVDSMGAGLGTGLLTCRGAQYRSEGKSAAQTGDALEKDRENLAELFTVDDLMFLRGTGRISAATAALGTVLNIKPLLRGDEEGHIVSCAKCRGRKKAMEAIVARYAAQVREPEKQLVAISHGDCPEDARRLAEMVTAAAKPGELVIVPHEPFTGAHVGPGMLALFFFGSGR